jgi:IPT/TIG domain
VLVKSGRIPKARSGVWRIAVTATLVIAATTLSIGATSSTAGATNTWSAPVSIDPGAALTSVSCVSTSFCLAVDNNGFGFTWNGTRWSPTGQAGLEQAGLYQVSCSKTALCAAGDQNGQFNVFFGGEWHGSYDVNSFPITSMSCVGSSFCLGWGYGGDDDYFVYDGTNVNDEGPYEMYNGIDGVSCVSTNLCQAVDWAGNLITYNGSTWSGPFDIDSTTQLNSISCPVSTFCAAVDQSGNYLADNNGTWSNLGTYNGGQVLNSVSCPTASFCSAVDTGGGVLTYVGSTPSYSTVDPGQNLTGISCVSATFCAAVDGSGNALIYSNGVAPPSITSFTPTSGKPGKAVTIKGKNLSGATSVTFDGVKATITSDTATQIKVKVPKEAKTGKIAVTTPGGTATSATKFKVMT